MAPVLPALQPALKMAYLKLPFVRRLVILVLCDVLCFKLVGLPYEAGTNIEPEHGKDVDIDKNVLEQVLEGTWNVKVCGSLAKCPDTTLLIYYRKLCFPPAPPGKEYHCGFDPDANRFVDFYRRPFMCPAGTYGSPRVHKGNRVEMVCRYCPQDRFNPIDRYSPDSMDECRSHYHKPVTEAMHVILYRPGNRTDPAMYYCDYRNKWVSEEKKMFCQHSYYPCRCINVGDMCFAKDLLPDWSCAPKCNGPRPPQYNFSCIPEAISPSTEDTLDRKTSHPSAWPWLIYTTNTPQNNESSSPHPAISNLQTNPVNEQEDQSSDDGHEKHNLVIILIFTILVIIIVLMVLCVIVYNLRRQRHRIEINITNNTTHGDSLRFKGKHLKTKIGTADNSSNSAAESNNGVHAEDATNKDDETKQLLL